MSVTPLVIRVNLGIWLGVRPLHITPGASFLKLCTQTGRPFLIEQDSSSPDSSAVSVTCILLSQRGKWNHKHSPCQASPETCRSVPQSSPPPSAPRLLLPLPSPSQHLLTNMLPEKGWVDSRVVSPWRTGHLVPCSLGFLVPGSVKGTLSRLT